MKKILIMLTFVLAACSEQPRPYIAPQPQAVTQPVPYTEPRPAQSHGNSVATNVAVGAIAGALGGYMLGKALAPKPAPVVQPRTIIVERPVYRSPPPRVVSRNTTSTFRRR